jgi:hypothetical protein
MPIIRSFSSRAFHQTIIFTYIEGGYENVSIGFWEGMEICTWNFIYPPPPSSNYFMTGALVLCWQLATPILIQTNPFFLQIENCFSNKNTEKTRLKIIAIPLNRFLMKIFSNSVKFPREYRRHILLWEKPQVIAVCHSWPCKKYVNLVWDVVQVFPLSVRN